MFVCRRYVIPYIGSAIIFRDTVDPFLIILLETTCTMNYTQQNASESGSVLQNQLVQNKGLI